MFYDIMALFFIAIFISLQMYRLTIRSSRNGISSVLMESLGDQF